MTTEARDIDESTHWLTVEDIANMTAEQLDALKRAQYGSREG